MRKIILFLLGTVCLYTTVKSQQLNPSVIATQGGISKAAGIVLEWTLGEPFTESLPVSNGLYTQGFHQPMLVVTKMPAATTKPAADYKVTEATAKTVADHKKTVAPSLITNYKITVAPNPAQSYLIVSMNAPDTKEVILSLIDFTGRIISVKPASGKITNIRVDMTPFIAGIYLLEIRKASGELIQSFKIIKAQ